MSQYLSTLKNICPQYMSPGQMTGSTGFREQAFEASISRPRIIGPQAVHLLAGSSLSPIAVKAVSKSNASPKPRGSVNYIRPLLATSMSHSSLHQDSHVAKIHWSS